MAAPGKTVRRRIWFDPRFLIGIVLVAASVAGVYAVVANAQNSTPVFAARSALAVGEQISAADLVVTSVRLAGADALYLSPAALPATGAIVTRTVAAGELLPVSAVGSRDGASVTSVVVPVRGSLAAQIGAGTVVDVWSSSKTDAAFGAPAILVANADVVRIIDQSGLVTTGEGSSVEVLVPKTAVAAVLEAVMNGDAIAVVPVNTRLGE